MRNVVKKTRFQAMIVYYISFSISLSRIGLLEMNGMINALMLSISRICYDVRRNKENADMPKIFP